jgi:hypothetical protein
MSEIQYVNRLGDALDAMAVAPVRRRRPRSLPQLGRRHPRILAFAVVLLLAGCSATAATLFAGNPVNLAARGISCANGTPAHETIQTFNVTESDLTPVAACARIEHIPAQRLIACASSRFGVNVYVRDGRAGECAGAGMGALPKGYVRAADRIARLVTDLNRLYASRNCFTPMALVSATQSTLRRLGFRGWRAVEFAPPHSTRFPCGQYPASGSRWSDAASALSGAPLAHTLDIQTGPSRRTELRLQALYRRNLLEATGARCYSIAGIQALVHSALASIFGGRPSVLYAARAEPSHTQMGVGRQPRYDAGCATLIGVSLTPQGSFDVLIWKRGWPAVGPGNQIPQSAYKRSLPAKP